MGTNSKSVWFPLCFCLGAHVGNVPLRMSVFFAATRMRAATRLGAARMLAHDSGVAHRRSRFSSVFVLASRYVGSVFLYVTLLSLDIYLSSYYYRSSWRSLDLGTAIQLVSTSVWPMSGTISGNSARFQICVAIFEKKGQVVVRSPSCHRHVTVRSPSCRSLLVLLLVKYY
jgi:hypothetical protein